jgi:drug/metabolite transporter (DMT)-like permease
LHAAAAVGALRSGARSLYHYRAARVSERHTPGAWRMSPALLLGGLGALSWGAGALLSARSSRAMGAAQSVLSLGIAGVPFGVALALAGGPLSVRTADVPGLLGASMFLLFATQLWAMLVRRGTVSLAAPIVACDGAVAALAAVIAGHRLAGAAYAGLTLMVAGLVVLSGGGTRKPEAAPERPVRRLSRRATIWIAVLTAGCYGGMLYCAGGVEVTSPIWTVTIARAGATVGAFAICIWQRRVRANRFGAHFAAGAGILDVTGFALFVAGARHDLAIASVAASQYGAVTSLAAVAFLRERLTRRQIAGVAVLIVGAALVAATG